MNMEDLFRKAIAAEAKATRRKSKDVARVWALTYAEAAVALFERLRIDSGKARRLLDVARAYQSRQADVMQFERAWRAFNNSNSGRYRAAILAHSAILKATDAVKDAWPVERLAEEIPEGGVERHALSRPDAHSTGRECAVSPSAQYPAQLRKLGFW
mgnify:CR=1 FL=1